MARLSTTLGALAALAAAIQGAPALARQESSATPQIAGPIGDGSGYARWQHRICVSVPNLTEDVATYVVGRISDVATAIGLSREAAGCSPNVTIVFAPDGAGVASGWVDRDPHLFRPYDGVSGTTLGLAALEEFKTSDAPVRWWQVTMPVDRQGNPAIDRPNDHRGPPAVAGANSLITSSTEPALWSSYIVVDTSKVEGFTWTQLADYLTMVTLTQVNPQAGADGSILSLFDSAEPPQQLTAWDEAYLFALYEIDLRLPPDNQRAELARLVAAGLASTN